MPKIVEIPNIGIVEFPDDMPDAEIGNVIRQQHYMKNGITTGPTAPPPEPPSVLEQMFGPMRGLASGYNRSVGGIAHTGANLAKMFGAKDTEQYLREQSQAYNTPAPTDSAGQIYDAVGNTVGNLGKYGLPMFLGPAAPLGYAALGAIDESDKGMEAALKGGAAAGALSAIPLALHRGLPALRQAYKRYTDWYGGRNQPIRVVAAQPESAMVQASPGNMSTIPGAPPPPGPTSFTSVAQGNTNPQLGSQFVPAPRPLKQRGQGQAGFDEMQGRANTKVYNAEYPPDGPIDAEFTDIPRRGIDALELLRQLGIPLRKMIP